MTPWLPSLVLLIVFELIADVLAKEWSLRGSYVWWAGALISYVAANSFWLYSIRHGSGLGRGAIIFSVVSAILAVIVGVFLYREILTKTQVVGSILGIIALILIFWD